MRKSRSIDRIYVHQLSNFEVVLEAECSLLTKLRQQRMLNEKQVFNTYLLMTKMELKLISKSFYNVYDALINWGGCCQVAQTWWLRK